MEHQADFKEIKALILGMRAAFVKVFQKISETISMTCEDILFVDGVLPDVDLLIRHLIR